MTPHDHREFVPGCFRCELGRDEAEAPEPVTATTPGSFERRMLDALKASGPIVGLTTRELAALTGLSLDQAHRTARRLSEKRLICPGPEKAGRATLWQVVS